MNTNVPVQEVNRDLLTGFVRKALNRSALQIADWEEQTIYGGFEWESALLRFQGEASDGGETIPWSLILKVVRPSEKTSNPAGFRYWKREALAYQSGLLDQLPGGNLTAPTCYGVYERLDGSAWIWMEDVKDDIESPWPIEHYAVAARHLGQFNGAYLTGEPIPHESWIAHNWLRMYVENSAEMVEFIRKTPHHSIVQRMYSDDRLAQILLIWEKRDRILKSLESLPQVLCHQDAFRRNLFTRGGHTIAIDWGYLGNAPVGAELAALVLATAWVSEIPATSLMEMDHFCCAGYLQGLRDAGWNGDPKQVRTGFTSTMLMRYMIGGLIGELLPAFLDREMRSRLESAFDNKPASELEQTDPNLSVYTRKVSQEALDLLGIM